MAGRHKNGVLTEYSLQDEGELAVVKAADAITYQKIQLQSAEYSFLSFFFLIATVNHSTGKPQTLDHGVFVLRADGSRR